MKAGWKLVSIGDVCKTGAGGTPLKSRKEYYNGGTIPWLLSGAVRQGEILSSTTFITEKGLNNSSAKLFPKDTVLVAMYGATAGEVGILRFKASTNQAVCGIYPCSKIKPEFLYYAILSSKADLIATAAGNAQPNISQQKIRRLQIPLPPLPEQERIVAILDEAFATIDKATANTQRNLANARELFDSELNRVFSQKGEGWVEKRLQDVVDNSCTLSYGIVQPGIDFSGGLPVVRPIDMAQKFITRNSLKLINPELAIKYSRTKLNGGELLICVRGTTGMLSIASDELKGANVTRGIVPILFNSELISQEFGYYLLMSNPVQKQIQSKTYGAALMQINIRDLRSLFVRFPDKDKQSIMSSKLNSICEYILVLDKNSKEKLTALTELKQSILQKAFTGELTANPDKVIAEAAQ